MSSFYAGCAAFLLLTMLAGIWRIATGPTRADRIQTAMLSGTAGTALLILLWLHTGEDALLDIALVLALFSAVFVITFTKRVWQAPDTKGSGR